MNLRTVFIGRVSALLGLGVVLAVVSPTSAQAPEKETAPSASLVLHFSLRQEDSGKPSLHLDMPVNEDSLRLLLSGQEKHPAVFLSASRGIPYAEVVKVIDMLGTLGLNGISLYTKHATRP
jgi:biopolymer transport protein ExbD